MKTSMEDGKHEKKSNQRMLSAALIAGTLAGCGSDNSDSTESTAVESTAGDSTESADSSDGETEGNSKYKDFITVDVFDSMANYQGIQSGWFAKIVKDKFNMELNIIAQNVAGGGDTLFQTRSAAGDLGDLIITGCGNGRLQNLVTAGLVIDMTDYLKDAEKSAAKFWVACNQAMQKYVETAAASIEKVSSAGQEGADLIQANKKMAESFTAQMEDFAQYQRLSYKTMEQVRRLLSEVSAANTRDVSLIASGRNDSMDKLADLIAEQDERQQALLEEINKNMKELSKAAQKGKFGLFR